MKFYITTTLPYVNADPHIGFALEIVQADIIARFQKQLGNDVIFNTGTDEHGIKIYKTALKENKDPQAYVDEYALKFENLKNALNLSYTNFIRTTNKHHLKAAQEFWKICETNGDIYKKNYKIKYCIGCELEKTESELENDKCPIHPNLNLESIEEENYFFKWSNYTEKLLNFYETHPNFVVPANRLNEIRQFVKSGLKDFSISRLKEKMPWGIPVPGDDKHVMYVWFDALINYISTLGWPDNLENFHNFWGKKDNINAIQIAGKDNLRQQSAMWQAMLMSADLPNSKQIIIHGFITSNGEKMSKSLGNVVNPFEIVEKFSTDAFRFWAASEISPFEDGDFSWEKFQESYNSNLANGLGNLVARVAKLCEKVNLKYTAYPILLDNHIRLKLENYKFNEAIEYIWIWIKELDQRINKNKPWELEEKELTKELEVYVQKILDISFHLMPFMPQTAEKIEKQFNTTTIKSADPLFPRIK